MAITYQQAVQFMNGPIGSQIPRVARLLRPSRLLFSSSPTGQGCSDLLPRYRDWETDRKSTRLNSSH